MESKVVSMASMQDLSKSDIQDECRDPLQALGCFSETQSKEEPLRQNLYGLRYATREVESLECLAEWKCRSSTGGLYIAEAPDTELVT